jgi:hypothetical protein
MGLSAALATLLCCTCSADVFMCLASAVVVHCAMAAVHKQWPILVVAFAWKSAVFAVQMAPPFIRLVHWLCVLQALHWQSTRSLNRARKQHALEF